MIVNIKPCLKAIWRPALTASDWTSFDQRFAVKNSGTSCLALIFDLNNTKMNI